MSSNQNQFVDRRPTSDILPYSDSASWAYLAQRRAREESADAPVPARAPAQPSPLSLFPVSPAPVSLAPVSLPRFKVQWEMVIPKMVRPPPRPAPAAVAAPRSATGCRAASMSAWKKRPSASHSFCRDRPERCAIRLVRVRWLL